VDKLNFCRQSIRDLLTSYDADERQKNERESQLIFDRDRDHYLWLYLGWNGYQRIYFTIIHFDIKNGKVWLQHNATDLDPAAALVKMGVERQDIILGLQPPYKSPYTDYVA
jgi:hypothetical protein